MIHEDSQNETAETEVLSADDQKVAQMLGSLRIVDAPKDFDFRLKARIANSSPADYKPKTLLPILRYAVPLSLMLLIGAMFVLNKSNGTGNNSSLAGVSQPVGSMDSVEATPSDVNNVDSSASGETPRLDSFEVDKRQLVIDINVKPKEITAGRTGNSSTKSPFNRRLRTPEGGSIDQALTESNKTIFPRGINPNVPVNPEKPPEFDNTKQFTVREILSAIGIEADFGENAWTVTSLKKGSLSERAGILKGDLIEAIDGQPIGVNAVFTGSVGAKTVTVRRNGRIMQLNL